MSRSRAGDGRWRPLARLCQFSVLCEAGSPSRGVCLGGRMPFLARRPLVGLAKNGPLPYSTVSAKLSEWLLNSGAYMHSMAAKPV